MNVEEKGFPGENYKSRRGGGEGSLGSSFHLLKGLVSEKLSALAQRVIILFGGGVFVSLCFRDRISLCSRGYLGTHSVDRTQEICLSLPPEFRG